MLEVRGVLPAEEYPDEPVQDRRAPRGGGGRKHGMGMRAPPAKKGRAQGASGARAEQASGEGEEPPEKRPRLDRGEAGPEAPEEEEYPDPADVPEEEEGWADLDDFEDPGLFCPFDGFDDDGDAGGALGPFGGAELEEADGRGMSLEEEMGWSRRGDDERWGHRYFEPQKDAECGQHVLNNVLGGRHYRREDLQGAAKAVVATTREDEDEHIGADGWYSHSVLATVLQRDSAKRGKMLFNRLGEGGYQALMHDDLVYGAVVNQNQAHWIALVKHNGLLWHVDSRRSPRPMDETAFRNELRKYPDTFAVARCQHPGE